MKHCELKDKCDLDKEDIESIDFGKAYVQEALKKGMTSDQILNGLLSQLITFLYNAHDIDKRKTQELIEDLIRYLASVKLDLATDTTTTN